LWSPLISRLLRDSVVLCTENQAIEPAGPCGPSMRSSVISGFTSGGGFGPRTSGLRMNASGERFLLAGATMLPAAIDSVACPTRAVRLVDRGDDAVDDVDVVLADEAVGREVVDRVVRVAARPGVRVGRSDLHVGVVVEPAVAVGQLAQHALLDRAEQLSEVGGDEHTRLPVCGLWKMKARAYSRMCRPVVDCSEFA
jgi:hypothetical protein